jgi:hypothetical protein
MIDITQPALSFRSDTVLLNLRNLTGGCIRISEATAEPLQRRKTCDTERGTASILPD